MIYIRNDNSVIYSGQAPNYIGDFLGRKHYLNNRRLLYYDPNMYGYSIINNIFKELYSEKLIDLIPESTKFLKKVTMKKSKV